MQPATIPWPRQPRGCFPRRAEYRHRDELRIRTAQNQRYVQRADRPQEQQRPHPDHRRPQQSHQDVGKRARLLAFPPLILPLGLLGVLGTSLAAIALAIAIVFVAHVARVTRASTLVARRLPYVEAALAAGAGDALAAWNTPRLSTSYSVRSPMTGTASSGMVNAVSAGAGQPSRSDTNQAACRTRGPTASDLP